jgi:hypothetical protein
VREIEYAQQCRVSKQEAAHSNALLARLAVESRRMLCLVKEVGV